MTPSLRDSLAQVQLLVKEIEAATADLNLNMAEAKQRSLYYAVSHLFEEHGPALLAVVEGREDA